MDRNTIREFVLELIEQVEMLGEESIWERSGSITKDLEKHKLEIENYKKKLDELLK